MLNNQMVNPLIDHHLPPLDFTIFGAPLKKPRKMGDAPTWQVCNTRGGVLKGGFGYGEIPTPMVCLLNT
jgi:hypothetical protein